MVCCPSFTYPKVACFPLLSSAIIRGMDEIKVLNLELCRVVDMLDRRVCGCDAGVVGTVGSCPNPMQMLGVDRESDKGAILVNRTTRIEMYSNANRSRELAD